MRRVQDMRSAALVLRQWESGITLNKLLRGSNEEIITLLRKLMIRHTKRRADTVLMT